MDVRHSSLPSPDVIAVRRDLSYQTGRGQGRRISSDALSVYLKGGPRYRLDDQTYDFAAPVAMLVAEGTLDQDLQQGRLDGIFVLFRGRGLLRKADGRKGQVLVSLGKTRLPAPTIAIWAIGTSPEAEDRKAVKRPCDGKRRRPQVVRRQARFLF